MPKFPAGMARTYAPFVYATAYHEAGHAIVGMHLGHSPESVTILPGRDRDGARTDGMVCFDGGLGNFTDEEATIICMAGFAAEHFSPYGPGPSSGASGDFARAHGFARGAWAEAARRATRILEQHRRALDRLAAELLDHKRLDGARIQAITGLASRSICAVRRMRLPMLARAASVTPTTFDADSHTVDVVFSAGATVRRRALEGEFDEELVVTPGAVRLGRLNSGAPFLNTHWNSDLRDVIGSVVPGSAKIEAGEGRAKIRLTRRPEAAGIVQDIRDGVIRSVSVGYRIHAVEKKERKDRVPLHRVIDWEPMEISAVPIPADPGAHVRRWPDRELFDCRVVQALAEHNAVRRIRMAMSYRHALGRHH